MPSRAVRSTVRCRPCNCLVQTTRATSAAGFPRLSRPIRGNAGDLVWCRLEGTGHRPAEFVGVLSDNARFHLAPRPMIAAFVAAAASTAAASGLIVCPAGETGVLGYGDTLVRYRQLILGRKSSRLRCEPGGDPFRVIEFTRGSFCVD